MAVPRSGRLRLPRALRLQHTREFAQTREVGKRLVRGSLVLNWRSLPEGSPPRLGLITNRRVGGAVQRNRARRLLREAFRRHQHELRHPAILVIVARQSIVGRSFFEVEQDYLAALHAARLLTPAK